MAKKKYDDPRYRKNWLANAGKVQCIIVMKREKKEEIQIAAEAAGVSMNEYILQSIEQRLGIDPAISRGMGVIIQHKNGAKTNA